MIIGLIGFGKVSKTLFNLIRSENITFITSKEGRSAETIEDIENSGITILETFRDVANKSDILISATSPKSALDVAKTYGRYAKGTFLLTPHLKLISVLIIWLTEL